MIKNNLPIQVTSLDLLSKYNITKAAVAIGVFDGVHLGHRQIIKELINISEEYNAAPVVITFSPHPRQVLFPEKKLRFLRSPEKKAEILGSLGVKGVVTIPFNSNFANLEPSDFIKKLVYSQKIELTGICVGTQWKFGVGAKGNEKTLKHFSEQYGFIFKSVKETHFNGKIVSSTEIRKALAKGNFNSANQMLNCKYIISGYTNCIENYQDKTNYKVFIKYGVLPPKGTYRVYLNNENKEVSLNVISETELTISSQYLKHHKDKVDIEFKEAICTY